MSKIIDADKIEYGYLWKKKDGTAHSPAFAFKEDIMKQPELPTIQSDEICLYCQANRCQVCSMYDMFEGKEVFEVSK